MRVERLGREIELLPSLTHFVTFIRKSRALIS